MAAPLHAVDGRPGPALDPRLLLMHQVMLGDRTRLDAYDRALAASIRPGDAVADVGAGTLVLSLLALKHGARHVYAIEGDAQTAALARTIVEHNDLQGRITVLQDDARGARLPERVDLIVSEMMGNLGPEEEMAEVVHAAADRHLRPGGRVVPARLTTHLQAIEFDGEGWGVWSGDVAGYSLRPVQACAQPEAQVHFFSRPPALLSGRAALADQRLGDVPRPGGGDHVLRITSAGVLHAIMGCFTATLAEGVTLSNFPSYPGCNWGVWIWPVRHTAVAPGDVIRARMIRSASVRDVSSWRLDCRIARGH